MSIGSWDPTVASSAESTALDSTVLLELAKYSEEDQLEQLTQLMPADEVQRLAGIMQLDHAVWHAQAEALDSATLVHLIRFLAVAEQLPGWEAGAQSPVIPLAKILRSRGERLDKSVLLWLREVSDNRFLPYGPL